MKIILSLDGGGIKGIVQATILDYIERKVQEILGDSRVRLGNTIDLVAGTSTGSIIGALMLLPADKNIFFSKYTMQEILNMYFSFGENVFKNNFLHNLKSVWGIIGPKYPDSNIDIPLLLQLDHYKLKDLIKPCLFTGYDIDKRKVNIYTNHDKEHKYADYYIKDVVRGSTAIPSYFSPAYFRDGIDINTIVDGGVFAGNPSFIAYIEAFKTFYENNSESKTISPQDITIISIGAGKANRVSYPYSKTRRWGKAQWLLPVLDVLMSSSSEVIDYEMSMLFKSFGKLENYKRLNPPLVYTTGNATDSSKENIANLHKDAKNYIETNQDYLDSIAQMICDNNKIMKVLSD
jgi:uncharacterized protein